MALFDSIRAGASGATESYQIERSLMFNDNDQTDLKRTPSSSGDRRTMTFSFWVKHNTAGYEPEDGEDHYFYSAVKTIDYMLSLLLVVVTQDQLLQKEGLEM